MFKEALQILKTTYKGVFSLENLYAFYLGAALVSFASINVLQWQFYAIVVPTIMMINFFKKES